MGVESHSMDHLAAESLLSGTTRPEEAPDIRRVRALLGAAARPAPIALLSRDDRTIARMLDVIGDPERTPTTAKGTRSRRISGLLSMLRPVHAPRRRLLKTKLVGGFAVMTFLAGTGLAFAGALPGGMQDTASHLLRRVGIHIPEQRAPSGQHPVEEPGVDAGAAGSGSAIRSTIPRSFTNTGDETGGRAPSESSDQGDQGTGSGSGDHGDGSGSSSGENDQGGSGSGGDSGDGGQDSNSGDGQG